MKLVSISVKELKKRLSSCDHSLETIFKTKYPLGQFHCSIMSCSNCLFNVVDSKEGATCKALYGNYDFIKMKNHNFGKLRKVNRSHLLFFEV